jgi:hypothetical protein
MSCVEGVARKIDCSTVVGCFGALSLQCCAVRSIKFVGRYRTALQLTTQYLMAVHVFV